MRVGRWDWGLGLKGVMMGRGWTGVRGGVVVDGARGGVAGGWLRAMG